VLGYVGYSLGPDPDVVTIGVWGFRQEEGNLFCRDVLATAPVVACNFDRLRFEMRSAIDVSLVAG
jgi:hypothetical protein